MTKFKLKFWQTEPTTDSDTATTSVPPVKLEKTNRHLKKENVELKEKMASLNRSWQEAKTNLENITSAFHDLQNEKTAEAKACFDTVKRKLEEENTNLQARIAELEKRPTAEELTQLQAKSTTAYNELLKSQEEATERERERERETISTKNSQSYSGIRRLKVRL